MKALMAILLMVFLGTNAFAQHAGHTMHNKVMNGKVQTQCPMMGGEIDKSVFADYDGKRIYFAGKMCRDEFYKDPMKYIKKLESEGVILEKVKTENLKSNSASNSGKMKSNS